MGCDYYIITDLCISSGEKWDLVEVERERYYCSDYDCYPKRKEDFEDNSAFYQWCQEYEEEKMKRLYCKKETIFEDGKWLIRNKDIIDEYTSIAKENGFEKFDKIVLSVYYQAR